MADTAGIGGLNAVYITLEETYGTYVDPADGTGAWMPILSESLKYTEDKYYSPQIRNEVIVSDVKQSFYHVEGDIEFEVDAHYFPYFLYGSRSSVVETGVATPYTYKGVSSKIGSTYPGGSAMGLSITVVRNGEGFGYAGNVVGQFAFTIDGGILKCTASMVGLSEVEPDDLDTESWIAPSIFGADATTIYTGASATAPTFAPVDNFNGFTATINYNAAAQNRIRADRQATFISYGETELTYETELDFLDRTEYDKMVAATTTAIRMESCKPGGAGTFAGATEAVRIDFNRTAYDSYEVDTPGMGDLVTANVTGKGMGIAGGDAYSITCKSSVDLGFV